MCKELTREQLLDLLEFDAEISRFRWKKRPGNSRFNSNFYGTLAGCEVPCGASLWYRNIMVHGRHCQEHRLIWLYYYGQLPTESLDHINGDGLDNRIENLRLAPGNVNNKNQAKSPLNTSGIPNVYWLPKKNKYVVYVRHNRITHYGGYFKKEDRHIAAAKAAEMRESFGFSKTHGLSREARKKVG